MGFFSYAYVPVDYVAVIDVEALVLGPVVRVVEQVAFAMYNIVTGQEVMSEKHMIYQPMNTRALIQTYSNIPAYIIENSVAAYKRITADEPIHNDPLLHLSWQSIRKRLTTILRKRNIRVYAKGAAMERAVFGHAFTIVDLEDYGCPKYPLPIHDPQAECRFFIKFAPEFAGRTWF